MHDATTKYQDSSNSEVNNTVQCPMTLLLLLVKFPTFPISCQIPRQFHVSTQRSPWSQFSGASQWSAKEKDPWSTRRHYRHNSRLNQL